MHSLLSHLLELHGGVRAELARVQQHLAELERARARAAEHQHALVRRAFFFFFFVRGRRRSRRSARAGVPAAQRLPADRDLLVLFLLQHVADELGVHARLGLPPTLRSGACLPCIRHVCGRAGSGTGRGRLTRRSSSRSGCSALTLAAAVGVLQIDHFVLHIVQKVPLVLVLKRRVKI